MASDESVGRRTLDREGSWAVFQFPEIFASIEGNPFLNWQNTDVKMIASVEATGAI